MARRFVLLDRDGTLNVERHYLRDPAEMELLAGVSEGLRHLLRLGLGLVVVTNQSGIARGYFDLATLQQIHNRLTQILGHEEISLEGIYFCPHGPADGCACRKPRSGLALAAASQHGFDLRAAFVVGDKRDDVELARAVGATAILVKTGHGMETLRVGDPNADYVAHDLADAAWWIETQLE